MLMCFLVITATLVDKIKRHAAAPRRCVNDTEYLTCVVTRITDQTRIRTRPDKTGLLQCGFRARACPEFTSTIRMQFVIIRTTTARLVSSVRQYNGRCLVVATGVSPAAGMPVYRD